MRVRPLRAIARAYERVRNVRRFSRAPRLPRSWPTVVLWSATLIAAGALLVLMAVWAGEPITGRLVALRKTLVEPSVGLPVAFAILVLVAYSVRRLRLEWLAWRPGRIQVPDLDTTGLSSVSPQQLTDKFRSRLAGMRLESSSAAPSAQVESNFLSVLGAGGVSSSNILGTLVTLLRAAIPSFTYEVHGSVVELSGPPPSYRVSLQIVRLPNGGSSEVDITEPELDRAVRRAADMATAAILPRTRLCKGPWAAWRRYAMPGVLFGSYEDACQHEDERHYDVAHHLYFRALDADPMNVMIRLELGQLQEKLQRHLDALVTYTAIASIGEPGEDDGLPPGLYPRRAERERRRSLLLARYRRAVLLAEGTFMREWSTDVRDEALKARRQMHRHQMTPWLRARLAATTVADVDRRAVLRLLEQAKLPRSKQDKRLLHKTFTTCAIAEIDELIRELPLRWRLSRRPPLTARALRLTKLCIAERGRVAKPVSQPPRSVSRLAHAVDRVEKPYPRLLRQRLHRWEEHYNAACLFAIALLGLAKAQDAQREDYARKAIDRLEHAAASADSSFIARQRDWVTTEDPDLDQLRLTSAFKAFEAQYFPASQPAARRPIQEPRLVEMRCTRDLLICVAGGWEAVWRARGAATDGAMPQVDEQWWRDEHDAWRHVHRVSSARDARSRLDLVDAARAWHTSYGLDQVESVFARYELDALKVPDEQVERAAKDEITTIRKRLTAIAAAIDSPKSSGSGDAAFRGFVQGVPILDRWDAEPSALGARTRARLCARQARLWRSVHHWLELSDGCDADEHGKRFARRLRQTRWQWQLSRAATELRRAANGDLLG